MCRDVWKKLHGVCSQPTAHCQTAQRADRNGEVRNHSASWRRRCRVPHSWHSPTCAAHLNWAMPPIMVSVAFTRNATGTVGNDPSTTYPRHSAAASLVGTPGIRKRVLSVVYALRKFDPTLPLGWEVNMVHGSPGSTMAPGHQGPKRPICTLDRRNRRLRVQNVLQSGQAPPASWCPVPKAPGGEQTEPWQEISMDLKGPFGPSYHQRKPLSTRRPRPIYQSGGDDSHTKQDSN